MPVRGTEFGDLHQTARGGYGLGTKFLGTLDSHTLVDKMREGQEAQLIPGKKRIEKRTKQLAALSEMEELVKKTKAQIERLSNPYQVIGGPENAFGKKGLRISTEGGIGSEASNILQAVVTDSKRLLTKEYQIDVLQQATNDTVKTTGATYKSYASGKAKPFTSPTGSAVYETLIINHNAGATNIDLYTTDSLTTIVSRINAEKATTNVTASLEDLGDDGYQLVLTTSDTVNGFSLSETSGFVSSELYLDTSATLSYDTKSSDSALSYFADIYSTPFDSPGNINIDGTSIPIYYSDTLDGIVEKINKANDTTSVTASLVSLGFNEKALKIAHDDGSTTVDLSLSDAAVMDNTGLGFQDYVTAATSFQTDHQLGVEGSLVLSVSGGDSASVAITSDMTIRDIANQINLKTKTTGVQAEIMSINNQEAKLTLTAKETGKSIDIWSQSTVTFGANSGELHFSNATSWDDVALDRDVYTDQKKVQLVVNNGDIFYRENNRIEDLIAGLTLDVIGSGTVKIDVEEDKNDVVASVQGFVEAYNKLMEFIALHTEISEDGKRPEEAVLGGEAIIRRSRTALISVASAVVAGVDATAYKTLEQIGIRQLRTEQHKLEINAEKFMEAVNGSKYSEFQDVLQFNTGLNDINFRMTGRPEKLSSTLAGQEITVTLTNTGGSYSATFQKEGDTAVNARYQNKSIKGQGVFKDFNLFYTGTLPAVGESVTTTFTPTQGIADKFTRLFESWTAEMVYSRDGILESAGDINQARHTFTRSQEKDEADQKKIQKRIDKRVQAYEEQLTRIEGIQQKFKSTLNFLQLSQGKS